MEVPASTYKNFALCRGRNNFFSVEFENLTLENQKKIIPVILVIFFMAKNHKELLK